ncbi:MAG TPA: Lrp/AsnC family transcriptional regulator [Acidimicrobiales bacterium]|nr:Lrp/AsnC family transcriptional regulator [Acidimicrobiales bacterium]
MNPIEPAGGDNGSAREGNGASVGGSGSGPDGASHGTNGANGDGARSARGVRSMKPLGSKAGAKGTRAFGNGPSGLLDDANRAIIEALQRDGRLPYGTIAEEVGLSEAAVRRRVQRLREAGVMQIVAVTDPLQLGFHRQAMVGVRVEGDVRLVADKLSELEEVDYVVMCAGSFDLLVEVVCEDDDALFKLLNDSFRSIPGVRSTESFVYLKLAKQTYTWGTR